MADDIEAGKGSKRRHYAKSLGICVIPFVITILGIYAPTYIKDFPGFLFAASAFGIIPALLVALFFGGRNLGRIFFPLNPVEKAFQSLYKALRWKDPPEGEKYTSAVQEDIRKNLLDASYQFNQWGEVAEVMLDEAGGLLDDLILNIRNRVVPAAKDGSLEPETMRQLAKVLAKPTIDKMRAINTEIESDYDPEPEGEPFKARFREFFQSQPGHLIQAIVFGIGSGIFATFVFSVIAQQSFLNVLVQNIGAIIGGSLAVIGGFLGYLALQQKRSSPSES